MRERIQSLLFALLLSVLAGGASLLGLGLLFLLVVFITIVFVIILIILFVIIVLDYSEVVFESKGNDIVLEY